MALIITACVCKYSIVYSACLKVSLWSRWCWKQETSPYLTSIWIAGSSLSAWTGREKSLLQAKQRRQPCETSSSQTLLYWGYKKNWRIISRHNCWLCVQDGYLRWNEAAICQLKQSSYNMSSGTLKSSVEKYILYCKHTLHPACHHWNVLWRLRNNTYQTGFSIQRLIREN